MSKGLVKGHKQLVQSLGQLCQQHISHAFKKFNERCSTDLVGLAARAESNRLQTLYMDSQRLLRKQRSAIEVATVAALMEYFAALALPVSAVEARQAEASTQVGGTDSEPADGNNLKLLGHEDLEVMIALDNCSSRVHEELRGPLHQLEGRLKALVDCASAIKTLPLSPDAILEAFATAIDGDMVAVEVQLELIRLFDQCCFDKGYAEMLDEANRQLEEAGVSPLADLPVQAPQKKTAEQHSPELPVSPMEQPLEQPLKHSQQHSQPHLADSQQMPRRDSVAVEIDQVSEALASYANDKNEPPVISNSRVQTELLAKITSMLEHADSQASPTAPCAESLSTLNPAATNGQPQQSGEQSNKQSNKQSNRQSDKLSAQLKPCMDKPQLLAEINKHMHNLIANRAELLGNGQITRELATALKLLTADERGTRLHRNDQSLFQVVENIFCSFGQSMVVAPEVQQVINRCELPMLKMAIKKPLILEQENHPIRRLFNEMAKYAIGLEQGDCQDNQIYQQMLKLSESMVGESFDEQKLPAMLSAFMANVDRDKRETSVTEARELEQIAAQEKVNWARTRVEEEITRRLVGKKLSETVVDFIQRSWCVVMHMAHLRSGEAGSDWLVAIKILENLIYLARRQASEADRKYRHELIAHIDARLGHIAVDIAQRSLQVKQLSQALGVAELPKGQSAVVTAITPSASKRRRKKPAAKTAVSQGAKSVEQDRVEEVRRIVVSAVKAELPGKNISQAVRDAESLDSSAQRVLMALQKGCWIELGGDIKAHKRGKLAGIVGPSWKYVFVDNKGKLIAERDRARLALELLDGKVTVLDNSHLFDKAIKQAITQIKGLPVAS